ncbi:uncharacterized protein HfgLR_07475 [Haloferax gibbonsii]|uniref:Lipoprotein n=1 Tax=Haloferax gibbonsii TaxID=35746 RepID=A0A871BEU2_HALGI|nr:hypothetical protein [Haloferax gibbonsii]QOS11637.1 uncharacterized protein HfgLR_07475 [Haloferax gibbonsii]
MRRRSLLQTITLSVAVAGCTGLDQASPTRSPRTDSTEPETASKQAEEDSGWLSVQWSEEVASDISVEVFDGSGEAAFSETIRTENSTDPRSQGFTNVFQTSGEYEVIVRVAGEKQTKEVQATLNSSSGWQGVNIYVTSGPEVSIVSIYE